MGLVTPSSVYLVSRFEVFLVRLDLTKGHDMRKTRPCTVVSPDEMNRHIATVVVAPMTTKGWPYPTRVPVKFQHRDGQIVLDQIRTVDKSRLVKRLGVLDELAGRRILHVLAEMFAP